MATLGGLSRRLRRRPLNAEVNIINLVDVMLVLLIIFMVTAPILQGGIQVRLPHAASRPMQIPGAITVTVERSGLVSVGDDQRMSWSQFQTNFPVLNATRHPSGVFVRGDAGAAYGDVIRVLGVIRAAGVDKVGLVTELPAASPP
ncbi:MAG TPA: biopolymer transporter ExbD [Gemmatimonadales bacterium]